MLLTLQCLSFPTVEHLHNLIYRLAEPEASRHSGAGQHGRQGHSPIPQTRRNAFLPRGPAPAPILELSRQLGERGFGLMERFIGHRFLPFRSTRSGRNLTQENHRASRRAAGRTRSSGAIPAPVPPLFALPGSPSLAVVLVLTRCSPVPSRGACSRPCPVRRLMRARVRYAAILTRSLRAAASGRALARGGASGRDATPPSGSGPGGCSWKGIPSPSLERGSRRAMPRVLRAGSNRTERGE